MNYKIVHLDGKKYSIPNISNKCASLEYKYVYFEHNDTSEILHIGPLTKFNNYSNPNPEDAIHNENDLKKCISKALSGDNVYCTLYNDISINKVLPNINGYVCICGNYTINSNIPTLFNINEKSTLCLNNIKLHGSKKTMITNNFLPATAGPDYWMSILQIRNTVELSNIDISFSWAQEKEGPQSVINLFYNSQLIISDSIGEIKQFKPQSGLIYVLCESADGNTITFKNSTYNFETSDLAVFLTNAMTQFPANGLFNLDEKTNLTFSNGNFFTPDLVGTLTISGGNINFVNTKLIKHRDGGDDPYTFKALVFNNTNMKLSSTSSTVKKDCIWIGEARTDILDKWCNQNCNNAFPSCPPSSCYCRPKSVIFINSNAKITFNGGTYSYPTYKTSADKFIDIAQGGELYFSNNPHFDITESKKIIINFEIPSDKKVLVFPKLYYTSSSSMDISSNVQAKFINNTSV